MFRVFCLLVFTAAALSIDSTDPKAIVEKQFVAIKAATAANDQIAFKSLIRFHNTTEEYFKRKFELFGKFTFAVLRANFENDGIKSRVKFQQGKHHFNKTMLLAKSANSSTGYITFDKRAAKQ